MPNKSIKKVIMGSFRGLLCWTARFLVDVKNFLKKIDIMAFLTFCTLVVLIWQTYETRKSMKIDQRAWVGMIGGDTTSLNNFNPNDIKPGIGMSYPISITFTNSGKTPALDFEEIALPVVSGEQGPCTPEPKLIKFGSSPLCQDRCRIGNLNYRGRRR